MVHICLDTNETLFLSVCTIDVYVCTFLGNKISINQWYSSQINWLTRGSIVWFLDWSEIKASMSLPLVPSKSFSSLGRSITKWLDFMTWRWRRISAISVLKHTPWICRNITCSACLNSDTIRDLCWPIYVWEIQKSSQGSDLFYLRITRIVYK